MDFFGNLWNSINSFLFTDENATSPPEQTVAPFNLYPVDFDITAKPIQKFQIPVVEVFPIDQSDAKPPVELTEILNDLLNSFSNKGKPSNADFSTTGITTMGNPVEGVNTFVKVIEDATGKTIEVVYEAVSETSVTAEVTTNTLASTTVGVFNATKPLHKILTQNSEDDSSHANIYIIAALVLLIAIAICGTGIMWCRKNRLKAERRNEYPVMAVVNNEYMDPQVLKHNEKLKNIP